jgi:hypothetical protein
MKTRRDRGSDWACTSDRLHFGEQLSSSSLVFWFHHMDPSNDGRITFGVADQDDHEEPNEAKRPKGHQK